MQVAAEQSAGNGKSNLRRLKKQFKALKSTFTVYDMKEGFIDGQFFELQRPAAVAFRWPAEVLFREMPCGAWTVQVS